jgi:hypothetical protein
VGRSGNRFSILFESNETSNLSNETPGIEWIVSVLPKAERSETWSKYKHQFLANNGSHVRYRRTDLERQKQEANATNK